MILDDFYLLTGFAFAVLFKHVEAAAVGALNAVRGFIDMQKYARMAERATSVAGKFHVMHFNGFKGLHTTGLFNC
jgi:hypothetical protein